MRIYKCFYCKEILDETSERPYRICNHDSVKTYHYYCRKRKPKERNDVEIIMGKILFSMDKGIINV